MDQALKPQLKVVGGAGVEPRPRLLPRQRRKTSP